MGQLVGSVVEAHGRHRRALSSGPSCLAASLSGEALAGEVGSAHMLGGNVQLRVRNEMPHGAGMLVARGVATDVGVEVPALRVEASGIMV